MLAEIIRNKINEVWIKPKTFFFLPQISVKPTRKELVAEKSLQRRIKSEENEKE